ncbi:hypothetical protein My1_007 [Pectobacterium phage My1]|uniref:Uncharacterized protein n=1 Tax=Pectobacterium phage My1 TaxID=1204539 RepID=J9QPP6_9CAUD|nr:hypothetical protein My1_007 [Pectobacterium phage My1]AFQ22166.1 hypothetical protein My1_007 [Pectobacterium phage My1]
MPIVNLIPRKNPDNTVTNENHGINPAMEALMINGASIEGEWQDGGVKFYGHSATDKKGSPRNFMYSAMDIRETYSDEDEI